MYARRSVVCGLLLCWTAALAAAAEGPAPRVPVGEFGDLRRLEINFATTFTPEQIRTALRSDLGLRLAAHPAGDAAEFFDTLRRRIVAGYRRAGFPAAAVNLRPDFTARRLKAVIEEGPRCAAGEIQVEGLKRPASERLIERLTQPYPPSNALPKSFAERDGKTVVEWVDRDGKSVALEPAVWQRGKPAPFESPPPPHKGERPKSRLQRLVGDALADVGFHFANFTAAVVADEATKTATLKIAVADEGPPGTVGQIEVVGNHINTRDELLDYLQVQPGMTLARADLLRLKHALWRSGRFLSGEVKPVLPAAPDDTLLLRIEVAEYDKAPPLRQPLSDEQQVFLRFREFLADTTRWPGDLVVEVENEKKESVAAASFSPTGGVLLSGKYPWAIAGVEPAEAAIVATPKELALYSSRQNCCFVAPAVNMVVLPSICVGPGPDTLRDGKFIFNFGLQARSLERGEAPGVRLSLDLAPVALLACATGKDARHAMRDGVLTTTNREGTCWRIEAATGRLFSLSIEKSAEDKPDGAADAGKSPGKTRVTFATGELDRRLKALRAATAGQANYFEAARPVGSLLTFVCDEGTLAAWLRTRPGGERALAQLRRLLAKGVFAPVDQYLTRPQRPEDEPFKLDDEVYDPQWAANPWAPFALGALAMFDEALPYGSWPWTLTQEAALTVLGRGQHSRDELQRLYDSPRTGPLCYWSAARLLGFVNPPAAAMFAARGQQRLALEPFRSDCRPLLADDCLLGKCVRQAAAVVRELDDAELANLIAALPDEHARVLSAAARALRADREQPLEKALDAALEAAWQAGLKAQLDAALESSRQQATPAPPGVT